MPCVAMFGDSLVAAAQLADAPASDAEPMGAEQDRRWMAALYSAHALSIHRFLSDLIGDRVLAADATQETFVRAYRLRAKLDDQANGAPWLFGIARNVAREVRKMRLRTAARSVSDEHSEPKEACISQTPEGQLLDGEAVTIINAALTEMHIDRRAALLLRLDHGLSYEQIAATMGWSLAKVKVEIFRAREQLRAVMRDYQGGAR